MIQFPRKRMISLAYQPVLDWIAAEQAHMLQRVTDWANINTFSSNTPGLARLADILTGEFSRLGGEIRRHDLTPAESIDHRAKPSARPSARQFPSPNDLKPLWPHSLEHSHGYRLSARFAVSIGDPN